MKAFIQRCTSEAKIKTTLNGAVEENSFSGAGLIVLLCWLEEDLKNPQLDKAEDWILERVLGLRVFEDKEGKMNLSLEDYCKENSLNAGIMWVSQFTLAAELESGFRPSYTKAMNPKDAQLRYENFTQKILSKKSSHKHLFGKFGAHMELSFTNSGPVSLMLEA